MQSKKIFAIALALACVVSFAFVFPADNTDAVSAIEQTQDPEYGGFTDFDSGHFTVFLKNNTSGAIEVKVIVYDDSDDEELDSTVATIEADGQAHEVKLSFKFGSSGHKLVYFDVINNADESVKYIQHEGSFDISVSHSIWKNTSIYVILVVVILAVIIIAYIVMRNRGKKAVSEGKTFTQLEEERKAKKAGKVAEKKVYQAKKKE